MSFDSRDSERKPLFGRYGHAPTEIMLKKRFHVKLDLLLKDCGVQDTEVATEAYLREFAVERKANDGPEFDNMQSVPASRVTEGPNAGCSSLLLHHPVIARRNDEAILGKGRMGYGTLRNR